MSSSFSNFNFPKDSVEEALDNWQAKIDREKAKKQADEEKSKKTILNFDMKKDKQTILPKKNDIKKTVPVSTDPTLPIPLLRRRETTPILRINENGTISTSNSGYYINSGYFPENPPIDTKPKEMAELFAKYALPHNQDLLLDEKKQGEQHIDLTSDFRWLTSFLTLADFEGLKTRINPINYEKEGINDAAALRQYIETCGKIFFQLIRNSLLTLRSDLSDAPLIKKENEQIANTLARLIQPFTNPLCQHNIDYLEKFHQRLKNGDLKNKSLEEILPILKSVSGVKNNYKNRFFPLSIETEKSPTPQFEVSTPKSR